MLKGTISRNTNTTQRQSVVSVISPLIQVTMTGMSHCWHSISPDLWALPVAMVTCSQPTEETHSGCLYRSDRLESESNATSTAMPFGSCEGSWSFLVSYNRGTTSRISSLLDYFVHVGRKSFSIELNWIVARPRSAVGPTVADGGRGGSLGQPRAASGSQTRWGWQLRSPSVSPITELRDRCCETGRLADCQSNPGSCQFIS